MKNTNVIKGKKGQQLNQREAKLINDLAVDGLLSFNIKIKNNNITLTYDTDGLICLQEFLRLNEMSKRLFVVLMRNVVIALKEIDSNKLSRDLIVWDMCTTYVDPSSWRVYLMYVPLQPYETGGNLETYLRAIISACNFVSGENVDYAQALVNEINNEVTYTTYMLEAYCNRLSEELLSKRQKQNDRIVCPFCKAKLMPEEIYCPFCGAQICKNMTSSAGGSVALRSEPIPLVNTNDADEIYCDTQSTFSRSDISISEDENGVVTVFRSPRKATQSVWLEDLDEHGGKIYISKFPFRIGKMEGVTDYRIYNNAVSRKHANILREQGKYYVVDLGSTNGTYLNGKRIQPGVQEELSDGFILRFADVEYIFHLD